MVELKPCPVCGKPVELEGGKSWDDKYRFLIKCHECGCSRVADTEKDECVRLWNALPRPLRWTKEPPTETGIYWFRRGDISMVVKVYRENGELLVLYHGNDEDWDLPEGEWAGPIQEPVE